MRPQATAVQTTVNNLLLSGMRAVAARRHDWRVDLQRTTLRGPPAVCSGGRHREQLVASNILAFSKRSLTKNIAPRYGLARVAERGQGIGKTHRGAHLRMATKSFPARRSTVRSTDGKNSWSQRQSGCLSLPCFARRGQIHRHHDESRLGPWVSLFPPRARSCRWLKQTVIRKLSHDQLRRRSSWSGIARPGFVARPRQRACRRNSANHSSGNDQPKPVSPVARHGQSLRRRRPNQLRRPSLRHRCLPATEHLKRQRHHRSTSANSHHTCCTHGQVKPNRPRRRPPCRIERRLSRRRFLSHETSAHAACLVLGRVLFW